jgi:hypothetical protein
LLVLPLMVAGAGQGFLLLGQNGIVDIHREYTWGICRLLYHLNNPLLIQEGRRGSDGVVTSTARSVLPQAGNRPV